MSNNIQLRLSISCVGGSSLNESLKTSWYLLLDDPTPLDTLLTPFKSVYCTIYAWKKDTYVLQPNDSWDVCQVPRFVAKRIRRGLPSGVGIYIESWP